MQQQVKQDKSETSNYTQPNCPTAHVNGCSKIKLHGLVAPLNIISLGMGYLDSLDHWITDPLPETNRSKTLTY